jgi:hypothetical protein
MRPAPARRRAVQHHGFQNREFGAAQYVPEARAAALPSPAQNCAQKPTQQTQRGSDIRFHAACCDDGFGLSHGRECKGGLKPVGLDASWIADLQVRKAFEIKQSGGLKTRAPRWTPQDWALSYPRFHVVIPDPPKA